MTGHRPAMRAPAFPRLVRLRRILASAAALAIVGLAVYGLIRGIANARRYVRNATNVDGRFQDDLTVYFHRFDPIIKDLPSRGSIGYRDDLNASQSALALCLCRYRLAPLIIDPAIRHGLVLGNFSRLEAKAACDRTYPVVRDAGTGVVVYDVP